LFSDRDIYYEQVYSPPPGRTLLPLPAVSNNYYMQLKFMVITQMFVIKLNVRHYILKLKAKGGRLQAENNVITILQR